MTDFSGHPTEDEWRERVEAVERQLEELRLSEARYRTLSYEAGDALFIVDSDNVIVDVNRQACVSLGYERSELIGMYSFDVEVSFPSEALLEEVAKARQVSLARGHKAFTMSGLHRRKDGSTFPVSVRLTPLPLEYWPERTLLVSVRDVSERVALEKQLADARRLEAVGRLAGGVAHDFNNMLSAILGSAELLALDLQEAGLSTVFTDEIVATSERAASLVQQLLAFSRRQLLHKESVDLAHLTEESLQSLHRVLGDDIVVDVSHQCRATVLGDSKQLRNLLQHLVVNARDAMPDGGRLRVTSRARTLNEEVEIAGRRLPPGDYVVWSVEDTGVGMSPEVLEHLFEPFLTTKRLGVGTGLGLATAHGIAHQHGGTIEVASEEGRGTEFSIWLPALGSGHSQPAPSKLTIDLQRGSGRVLIVDDSGSVRRYLDAGLRRLGYQVMTASNGREALAVLESDRVDLVLTDVVMPELGGIQLEELIADKWPSLPLVFMTGYTESQSALEEATRKGRRLLHKPLRLAQLSGVLRDSLAPGDSADVPSE